MKKLVWAVILFGVAIGLYPILKLGSPKQLEPERVFPVLVFEPENIETVETDFWSQNGRYGFVYLHNHAPIAYHYASGLFISYYSESSSNKPKVYVYDLWGGDDSKNAIMEVHPYKKTAANWQEMNAMSDAEHRTLRIPFRYDSETPAINEAIQEQIKQLIQKGNGGRPVIR